MKNELPGGLPYVETHTERCWTCEGSGIQPSILYLIPFWPKMTCRRCKGTGVFGMTDQTRAVSSAVLRSSLINAIDEAIHQVKDLKTAFAARGQLKQLDAAEDLLLEFVKIKVCAAEALIRQVDLTEDRE